jgi:hypothetical protein
MSGIMLSLVGSTYSNIPAIGSALGGGFFAGQISTAGKAKTKVGISGTALASAELLSDYLDTRVSIEQGKGKGKITIEFAGNEDLQRIVDLIEG